MIGTSYPNLQVVVMSFALDAHYTYVPQAAAWPYPGHQVPLLVLCVVMQL